MKVEVKPLEYHLVVRPRPHYHLVVGRGGGGGGGSSLPSGGADAEALVKRSSSDGDVAWEPVVNEFNGRTGSVDPQAGDYNAAMVGLGNVTNDAQLKRDANDFAAFPLKGTPDSSDLVLLEDSAAGGAKKYTTVGALGGGGGTAVVGALTSIYLAPPPSPDVWDLDCASMTDPDLAANGWIVRETAPPHNILVRAGDILDPVPFPFDNWATQRPAAGTYRSTLINGVLLLQFPGGGAWVQIYKPILNVAKGYTAGVGLGMQRDNRFAMLYVSTGAHVFQSGVKTAAVGLPNSEIVWDGPLVQAGSSGTGGAHLQAHLRLDFGSQTGAGEFSAGYLGRIAQMRMISYASDAHQWYDQGATYQLDAGMNFAGSLQYAGVLFQTPGTSEPCLPFILRYIRRRPVFSLL